ncbi:Uncharacterised protein [Mycobacteroides abscessus]|nr:Uncharacterised protein [Mycobacteroides abscessus]
MCRAMAAARPPSGASTRRGPGGLVAALATPRPVSAVHSGCRRGVTIARSTNVGPSVPSCAAMMKYVTFSTAANPRATIAA